MGVGGHYAAPGLLSRTVTVTVTARASAHARHVSRCLPTALMVTVKSSGVKG